MNELTRYDEFILEQQITELMLESQIVYSQRFIELLDAVGREDPIVTKLRSLQSQDKEIQQNYIDIGAAKDAVTFTPERKVRELLGNRVIVYTREGEGGRLGHQRKNRFVFARLGYEPEGGYSISATDATEEHPEHRSRAWNPPTGTIGRIVSTTQGIKEPIQTYALFECTEGPDAGKKCVINKSNLRERDNTLAGIWTTQRNTIKIGRLVRPLIALLGDTITDKQVEEFVNKYKSAYDVMNDAFARFDIIEGDDIAYWYKSDHYERPSDGVLGSSCMKNAPENYFKIYTRNPTKCKLVILYSSAGKIKDGKFTSKKICGRAILWTTDGGDTFMERIYTHIDSDVDLFKRFCSFKGWWCRTRQQYGQNFEVECNNNRKTANYIVSLERWDFNHFPFVDSICYMNSTTGKLSNIKANVQANRRLTSTSGGWGDE